MILGWILIAPAIATVVALFNRRVAPWITLASSIVVLVLSWVAVLQVNRGGTLHEAYGGLTLDAFAALYLLLVAFVSVTAALYSVGYLPAHYAHEEGVPPPRYRAYWPLFNLFLISMLGVPLVSNIAVMWISIELTTIFSAFLVAYNDRPTALEAAWKYVALTSVGAMIALFGVLVLYYGVNHAGQPVTWPGLVAAAPAIQPAVLLIAFALWLVGFGTKAGLVPMHTWLPDAHSQAPASICALLSGVEVSGALYMLLRIHPALMRNPGIAHPNNWYIIAGLVSVATAAFLLLQVHDYKRLFAYSTIEHMGVILAACGLGAGVGAHQLGTAYQFFAHAFTKSFCFYAAGIATMVFGTQEIKAVRGLINRAPLAGWALLLGCVAIAGGPPFALFISEYKILEIGFGTGQYAATGLLTALLVLAFIAILYKVGQIVFGEPAPGKKPKFPKTSMIALGIAFIPMLVFGFYLPKPLATLIQHAATILGGLS